MSGSAFDHERLTRLLQSWPRTGRGAGHDAGLLPGMTEIAAFGSDPGQLRMLAFVPDDLPPAAPLVVVLHGCTQTAAGYAVGAGWTDLAARHGFALLLPEQRRSNNANLCFDWFQPGDTARGGGEVASIRSMVLHMLAAHDLDRRRVFVTGLSAGGAMTGAMLASYPELFAGGAIIAGLPYGCAASVQEAFGAMHTDLDRPGREWGDLVRAASSHLGAWPSVSVWHGSADRTVRPSNAREILKQWLDVHGLAGTAGIEDRVDGCPHRVWRDRDGRVVVEAYALPGLDHGTPVAPRAADPDQRCGSPGPFILDAGIASSYRIAESWGLLRPAKARRRPAIETTIAPGSTARRPARLLDPGAVIGQALRKAGLIKD